MVRAILAIGTLLLGADTVARPQPEQRPCQEHPEVRPPCITVRGWLSYWNGTPTARIRVEGTGRIVGVSDGHALPGFAQMPRDLRDRLTLDVELLGDYEFCPFTPEKPGVMRLGCIQSARVQSARATAAARAGAADPVAAVREFYAQDSIRAYRFYSARLKALVLDDERRAGGEVGNLDFAFHVNAQDTDDGWERTLRLTPIERQETRAIVRAVFENAGPQELRYTLVLEGGRWLIDDVQSVLGQRWVLSELLAGGE